jgi:predicted nucleotidyltransferase
MNTEEIVARLKEFAQARSDIVALYLYGSYANDTARPHSDVDVAVLFSPEVPDALDAELKLGHALAALPGLERVEVSALNRAAPKLRAEILHTGRRVYCRDDEVRTAFEFGTMREWWDLQPWYAAYNQEYFAALKERFTDDQRRAYQRARQTLAASD